MKVASKLDAPVSSIDAVCTTLSEIDSLNLGGGEVSRLVNLAAAGAMPASLEDRHWRINLTKAVVTAFEPYGKLIGRSVGWESFWRHSVAVACASEALAFSTGLSSLSNVAFTAGLLHDVGIACLVACLPKAYARVTKRMAVQAGCLCDAERDVVSLDHTVAGRHLATKWALPEEVTQCIWLHHQPAEHLPPVVASRELVMLVGLANQLAKRQRIGYCTTVQSEMLNEAARCLGLSEDAVEDVAGGLSSAVDEQMSALGETHAGNDARLPSGRIFRPQRSEFLSAEVSVEAGPGMRRECVELLAASSIEVDDGADIGSVCRQLVRELRGNLGLESPAVFAICEGAERHPIAVCQDDDIRQKWLQVAWQGSVEALDHLSAKYVPVPSLLESGLLAAGLNGQGTAAAMLPLTHARRCVGGILLNQIDCDNSAALLSDVEAMAVSSTFGARISTALAQSRSRNLVEEVLCAARRKHAEHNQELRARSLSVVANMAAGAAHELNNPLAVIAGRAQLLKSTVTEEEAKRVLSIIDEHARKASDIISELMRFAKPDPPVCRSVNVRSWFERLRQYWQSRSNLKEGALVVEISDPALEMYADPAQLEEAVGAIIANSIEATTPENARLVVNSPSSASDETVVVAIGDNGSGMSPEVLEHAVDPFFSYRSAGRGRGLGLSNACRLVENNGGRLWIESTPGVGTTVHFSVPARPQR